MDLSSPRFLRTGGFVLSKTIYGVEKSTYSFDMIINGTAKGGF